MVLERPIFSWHSLSYWYYTVSKNLYLYRWKSLLKKLTMRTYHSYLPFYYHSQEKQLLKEILGRKSHCIMIKGKFGTLSNITDEAFVRKMSSSQKVLFFYKQLHHRSLTVFWRYLWWWLLLVTEWAFPIKQTLFSVLAKKTQHLFLTMAVAVPIKCMIKCNVENEKSCLRAWKIKQRKLNEMKT